MYILMMMRIVIIIMIVGMPLAYRKRVLVASEWRGASSSSSSSSRVTPENEIPSLSLAPIFQFMAMLYIK